MAHTLVQYQDKQMQVHHTVIELGGTLTGGQGNRHWQGYFDELRLTIGGNSSDAENIWKFIIYSTN